MKLLDILYERRKLFSVYFMLCSAAFLIIIFRQLLPTDKRFMFLLWNLFLALVPLAISSIIVHVQKQTDSKFILLITGAAWLVFFPNAPYIMTDYIHVFNGDRTYIILDLLTWAYFAIIAFIAALISLNDISLVLSRYFDIRMATMLILLICLLTSFGIYLGRDLRFNSWDVITKPHELVYTSINTVRTREIRYFNWVAASSISIILFCSHLVFFRRTKSNTDNN